MLISSRMTKRIASRFCPSAARMVVATLNAALWLNSPCPIACRPHGNAPKLDPAFTRDRPVGRFFFGKLMSSPRTVPTDCLPAQPDAAILRLARALARQTAREDHARELLSAAMQNPQGVEQ